MIWNSALLSIYVLGCLLLPCSTSGVAMSASKPHFGVSFLLGDKRNTMERFVHATHLFDSN